MKTHDHSEHHYAPIPLLCPICDIRRMITTFRTYRFIRYRFDCDTHVSCARCARRELWQIAKTALLKGGRNVLDTLVQIFQVIQIPFIRKDYEAVHNALLEKIGLSKDPERSDIALLGIYLAVSMIKRDDRVDKEEVQVAKQLGKLIFHDFDEHEFDRVMTEVKELPSTEIVATLLSNLLPPSGKEAVFNYLSEIAEAVSRDSELEERLLLIDIAANMDYDPGDIDIWF